MSEPTVGSLFSGVGLLDLGLHAAGFRHEWFCESDPWRRELLRRRWPGVPVFDDVRTLRGEAPADASRERRQQVASGAPGDEGAHGRGAQGDHEPRCPGASELQATPVDLVAGGFPCRGASTAGKREGLDNAETALWAEMRRVIRELRPRYVLIENVANILGMAAGAMEPPGSLWGTVVGDLAAIGPCDIRWDCVPAAAVGAPHLRDRVFCVAAYADGASAERDAGERREQDGRPDVAGGCAGPTADAARHGEGGAATAPRPNGQRTGQGVDWGDYEPAIRRWEAIHGPAPEPLVRRVDARSAARVDRSRLSALGDGVCVHVAYLVGRAVMHHYEHGTWG